MTSVLLFRLIAGGSLVYTNKRKRQMRQEKSQASLIIHQPFVWGAK